MRQFRVLVFVLIAMLIADTTYAAQAMLQLPSVASAGGDACHSDGVISSTAMQVHQNHQHQHAQSQSTAPSHEPKIPASSCHQCMACMTILLPPAMMKPEGDSMEAALPYANLIYHNPQLLRLKRPPITPLNA